MTNNRSLYFILRCLYCILFLLIVIFISACGQDEQNRGAREPQKQTKKKTSYTCRDCHDFTLDKNHNFACPDCHAGKTGVFSKEEAHEGLIAWPAHPDVMAKTCGRCHADRVEKAGHSLHFTLKNKVNIVRRSFGTNQELTSLTEIPVHDTIESPLALADDLLRRRCLRCHLYFSGDPYPETTHATGCAACHLSFQKGRLASHQFSKSPGDEQCLHCHYGNFVGADYHGRFEHDFHWDYRTPYTAQSAPPRPYGLEFHQLSPDIHQTGGLLCIDCHSGPELMTKAKTQISCESCHLAGKEKPPLDNLHKIDDALILNLKKDGRKIQVPQLSHPAHQLHGQKAHCSVCHAQWSFSDQGTHLLRQDAEDYDPWGALTVQGSFEVEDQLETNLYSDEEYPVPFMRDKITSTARLGIWLKGYGQRRWEFPLVCRGQDNRLHICRPILDLHLSFVDKNEKVIYDSVSPEKTKPYGLLPYTPHTTGKAGAFYPLRLKENYRLMKKPYNLMLEDKGIKGSKKK